MWFSTTAIRTKKKYHNENVFCTAQLTRAPIQTGKILGGMKWYRVAFHHI